LSYRINLYDNTLCTRYIIRIFPCSGDLRVFTRGSINRGSFRNNFPSFRGLLVESCSRICQEFRFGCE
jgi:hypothetical protein